MKPVPCQKAAVQQKEQKRQPEQAVNMALGCDVLCDDHGARLANRSAIA